MPRYAEIENKIIINVIVADEGFIAANKPDAIECPEPFGVGDGYDKKKFYLNQIATPIEETDETLA